MPRQRIAPTLRRVLVISFAFLVYLGTPAQRGPGGALDTGLSPSSPSGT